MSFFTTKSELIDLNSNQLRIIVGWYGQDFLQRVWARVEKNFSPSNLSTPPQKGRNG